jgi:hypothetical protein
VVDERALEAAYNDAVTRGNEKLARELLALWRDALPDRVAKHFRSTETPKRHRSDKWAVPLLCDSRCRLGGGRDSERTTKVTEAVFTYVALDSEGHPRPIKAAELGVP